MPLVPAAGYQTEPFPQTRAPERPPEDYQNIQARPEMFGAQVGQAQERFGAIAERGATELADRAVQIQLLNNQIVADKAQSDYTQRSNKLLYGDPSDGTVGLFAKHGAEAQEAARQIGPTLDKLRDDMAVGLPNARARLEFNEYTRRQRMFQDRDIFSHYERETQAYGAEVQKAAVVGAIQHAGFNYNDPEQIAQADTKADQASIRQAQNQGLKLTDEATANLVHLGRDHITQAVVEGYLSHNDPVGAQNFLRDRQIYDPKMAETLNKAVKGQAIDADVKQFLYGSTGAAQGRVSVQNVANNNPGNIKAPGGGYAIFPTPEAGVDAIGNWLVRAQANHGLTTVRQLIDDPTHGYAPSADPGNAGKNLPLAAAKIVGVTPDTPVNMSDPDMRSKMVHAILAQEGNVNFMDKLIQGVRDRYPDPQDFAKAMGSVEGMMRMMNMQGAAEAKAQNEADEKVSGDFMKRILKGEVVPENEIAGAIGSNGLKPRTAENLAAVAQGHLADQAASIPIKMGPGYWDVQKRIMLPEGNPNRISDVGDILALARPESGNWLTATGADKLMALAESKKTQQGASDAELQHQLFQAVHAQLSGHVPGYTHDTKGETLMLKFIDAYYAAIPELKKTMSMHEIVDLTKGPFASLMRSTAEGGLKRSMDEMIHDMTPDMNQQDTTGQPVQQRPAVGGTAPPTRYHYDTGGNRIP